MAVLVLDQMQMLDQQVALARAVAKQGCDFAGRLRIDLAALGRAAGSISAAATGADAVAGGAGGF